jgi:hypothetical protein
MNEGAGDSNPQHPVWQTDASTSWATAARWSRTEIRLLVPLKIHPSDSMEIQIRTPPNEASALKIRYNPLSIKKW